jgi:hypothetical protein
MQEPYLMVKLELPTNCWAIAVGNTISFYLPYSSCAIAASKTENLAMTVAYSYDQAMRGNWENGGLGPLF